MTDTCASLTNGCMVNVRQVIDFGCLVVEPLSGTLFDWLSGSKKDEACALRELRWLSMVAEEIGRNG